MSTSIRELLLNTTVQKKNNAKQVYRQDVKQKLTDQKQKWMVDHK